MYVRCCRQTECNQENRICWIFCRWYVVEKRFLANTWCIDSYFYWQWEGFRSRYSFQIMQRLRMYKKIVSSDPARCETLMEVISYL